MEKDKNLTIDFTIEELDERIEAILIKPLINDPNCNSCGCCYTPCYTPPSCCVTVPPPCYSNPSCPNVGITPQGNAR